MVVFHRLISSLSSCIPNEERECRIWSFEREMPTTLLPHAPRSKRKGRSNIEMSSLRKVLAMVEHSQENLSFFILQMKRLRCRVVRDLKTYTAAIDIHGVRIQS